MPDPVSWLVIERGWPVVGADGEELGRVDEVAGDTEHDIFDGIVVSRGLLKGRRYLPSEQVAEIFEGEVHVRVSKSAFESGADYEEPPAQEEILAPDRR
jgi:hypothetical protein